MGAFVCVPTDRLVFDGGAGHTEVQLAVLFNAGIDQSLHWALILEQQEGVAYTEYSRVIHAAGEAMYRQRVTLEFRAVITATVSVITTHFLLIPSCGERKRSNTQNASHNRQKTAQMHM